MSLGERLRRERDKKGWTQLHAAGVLGITNGALSNYERNYREPDAEMLHKFASVYNVTIDYLLGKTEPGQNPAAQPVPENEIPILGTIHCGIPVMSEENFQGMLKLGQDIKGDFALYVRGSSMIGAGIHEGDYAICRAAPTANSGDMVVAMYDVSAEYCEKTLKYFFNNYGKPVLRAANPEYEDIMLDENYRIAGVVTAIVKQRPPSYRMFEEYISTRDFALKGWNEVIERAMQCGIRPEQVKGIIEMQWQMAQQALKGADA